MPLGIISLLLLVCVIGCDMFTVPTLCWVLLPARPPRYCLLPLPSPLLVPCHCVPLFINHLLPHSLLPLLTDSFVLLQMGAMGVPATRVQSQEISLPSYPRYSRRSLPSPSASPPSSLSVSYPSYSTPHPSLSKISFHSRPSANSPPPISHYKL